MDDPINPGHPFYFPTQVILVDDDPDFLEGVSLMLKNDTSYQLFQSAHQALEYVNNAHKHVHFLKRCYSNYKTGPTVSDSLSHIDVGRISDEVLNAQRFQTASTVIVDYSMPEMNGLEFLASLQNPFIRKILLTGQGDMELAVKAFNNHLIDQFIDKHDPRLKNKLNAAIIAFQDQYFRSSFKLITDPILANNHEAFLVDVEFQRFFTALREKLQVVEYYMIDAPHAGFLLMDANGHRQYLLIYTSEDLSRHIALLEEKGAPEELLNSLKAGELLPDYDDQLEGLDFGKSIFPHWQDHYHEAITVRSRITYLSTLVPASLITDVKDSSIIAYNTFLEANFNLNEVVH